MLNPIAIVILAAFLLDAGLNFTADFLNLKDIRKQPPESFESWFAPGRYQASQQYLKARTRFGWVVRAFGLLVLLSFWFGGGFAWLDEKVRDAGWPMLWSGLIYIGILLGTKGLLSIPFDVYSIFVIEERFGFNKTTWKTYVKDNLKSLALALVLGAPLLASLLAFFQYAGSNAWWLCWTATIVFLLAVQYIAPTWIMPLFNRFEPLADGDLRLAILDYARHINFKLDNIFVMDGSKRSSKSNAFFMGFGRHRRIVLFDTLIENHGVAELVAVLAHEMGHYKKKHILKNLLIVIFHTGVMFYILSFFISYKGLFEAFYVQSPSIYAGLIFFGMLYAPLDGLMGIGVQAISRHHEYAADRFAVQTSGRKSEMIEALKKLTVHNLSNLQPHPFYVLLNYSHPPILKRIEAIEKINLDHEL